MDTKSKYVLVGSIALGASIAAMGCSAPVSSGGQGEPSGDEPVGHVSSATNPNCQHPTLGGLATDQRFPGQLFDPGPIQYIGFCYNGGDWVLVWATDDLTGQEVYNYQWVQASSDTAIFPGYVQGTLSGGTCPGPAGTWRNITIHAIDTGLNRQTNSISYAHFC